MALNNLSEPSEATTF